MNFPPKLDTMHDLRSTICGASLKESSQWQPLEPQTMSKRWKLREFSLFFFFPQPFFCSICCAPKAWTFYHTLRIEVWLHLLSIGVSFMTNGAFPQKLGFWEHSQVFWSSEGAGHPSHFSLQTFSECLRHELSIKTWYKAWFELHYPWCKFGRKFSPGNPPTGNHTGKKSENSRSFRFFGPVSKFWVFCVPKTWTFSHTLSKYVIFDFLSIGVGFRSGT